MRHERALLDRIVATRAALSEAGRRRNTRALGPLEQALRRDLGAVQAIAERYPALAATRRFGICKDGSASSKPLSPTAARSSTPPSL
jgi:hypothetical protein